MIRFTKTWVKYKPMPAILRHLYLYLQGNVINFRELLFMHCILWYWAVKETIVGLRNKTSCQKFWIALDMMYCYVISYPPICAAHFKGYFSWERILERQTISILSVMVETLTLNYTIKYILREIDRTRLKISFILDCHWIEMNILEIMAVSHEFDLRGMINVQYSNEWERDKCRLNIRLRTLIKTILKDNDNERQEM